MLYVDKIVLEVHGRNLVPDLARFGCKLVDRGMYGKVVGQITRELEINCN